MNRPSHRQVAALLISCCALTGARLAQAQEEPADDPAPGGAQVHLAPTDSVPDHLGSPGEEAEQAPPWSPPSLAAAQPAPEPSPVPAAREDHEREGRDPSRLRRSGWIMFSTATSISLTMGIVMMSTLDPIVGASQLLPFGGPMGLGAMIPFMMPLGIALSLVQMLGFINAMVGHGLEARAGGGSARTDRRRRGRTFAMLPTGASGQAGLAMVGTF